jgi:hypothetical protein
MGLLAWGTLAMTRQGATSSYQTNNANQARTAALIGISAIQKYANMQFASTSGAVAPNISSASAAINLSAPYMAATVYAHVTANTFSPGVGTSSEYIIIKSNGSSGNAAAEATAVLTVKTVNNTSQSIQNKITLSGKATLEGKQFGGASIGATSGSIINGTTLSGSPRTTYSIGALKNITVVPSIPVVNPDGFKQYASIQLLYNNGNPEMIIPSSASYIKSMYSVPPGTYAFCTNSSGCTGSIALSAKAAFSKLGISYSSGGSTSIKEGQWTLSSPLTAFIYSNGNVSLSFSGTANISVAADGVISTGAVNGKGSRKNDLYPFAQYPYPHSSSGNVCSIFENVCQAGNPIPDLKGFSISSNNGINLIHGTTIEGGIGSNGTITYNGGGSITINGAVVAAGLNVNGGSSIDVQGATKGSGLSSTNSIATFSGGQQIISLQSLYWN